VSPRLCAVSVDLDQIAEYRAIHGLAPARACHAVYDVALERMAAFARAERIPLTLFAVGKDLERPECAAALLRVATEGHVVESHSFGHRYDLARLSAGAIDAEVRGGADAIRAVTGRRPRGFRSPGYAICDALLDSLEREGVVFDASLLPSPSYYAAKLGALALHAARGRASRSVVHHPRTMVASRQAYRPARPWYRRGGSGLVELPMATTRRLRLPVIGTALALGGVGGARMLARGCAGDELVSLELHGIDFLDASDGLEDLAPHQPDLRIPVGKKQRAIGAALDVFRDADHRFVTLEEAATLVDAR
jgi:peptidoglycan-N-acetylglucosamine deacetylase